MQNEKPGQNITNANSNNKPAEDPKQYTLAKKLKEPLYYFIFTILAIVAVMFFVMALQYILPPSWRWLPTEERDLIFKGFAKASRKIGKGIGLIKRKPTGV